ncbi:alpha/beta hydrolase family protein [Kordiimonas sp.]|uniref:alpha/beta hydrolase family protein n=1 Tax=Kordiimonas sp. TaxID=1970157 RepID=UPI003A8E1FB0
MITFRKVFGALFAVMMALVSTGLAQAGPIDDADKTEVMIEAGDVTLGATLYRPAGISGPLPAIVTAHGSAPSTRDGVGFYTHHALKMGFAVLSFDKRGTGKSSGTYVPFSVETSDKVFRGLASDVEFAVRWIAAQPDIDTSRIGLFGGSQAGWIMPLAASHEPLVSFIIIGEGVPLTAYEEDFHGDITGEGEWLGDKINEADQALRAMTLPEDPGFDPAPVLKALELPTLWIFGLRDAVIPIAPSIARLEELIKSGKTNNELHVFAFGDHNFRNVATGERYDVGAVAAEWLKSKGVLR